MSEAHEQAQREDAFTVVIVSDNAYVSGGASRVAVRSARAIAERGVNVHFFAAAGPVCEDLQNEPNLQVTCLNLAHYNKSGFQRSVFAGLWDSRAKAALEGLLASLEGPIVVHFHSNRDALSSSVFAPVFARKLPVVYTCHEYGLACPYASFFDHKRNAPCGRKALSVGCLGAHCNRKGYDKKIWTFTRQMVQNSLLSLPNRVGDVVYVTEFSKRILAPYVGAQARAHLVANPIDAIRGEHRKLTSESPFLFAGFLTDVKDPVTAAKAAAQANVPIRFVGDGELRDAILEANPQAHVTGWLKPEEVRQEMLHARALVMPSIWYETQGMVVQEAMALGVPAIVSKACAAGEAVRDGVNGILVDPGSVEQFAAAMRMLSDDATACEMGKAASAAYWSKPAELSRHVDEILDVYRRSLAP
jgi:glycosyltransferase involved in cell wall biosynthesis